MCCLEQAHVLKVNYRIFRNISYYFFPHASNLVAYTLMQLIYRLFCHSQALTNGLNVLRDDSEVLNLWQIGLKPTHEFKEKTSEQFFQRLNNNFDSNTDVTPPGNMDVKASVGTVIESNRHSQSQAMVAHLITMREWWRERSRKTEYVNISL